MEARKIASDRELQAIAADGVGYVVNLFDRRLHLATCPEVLKMTASQPKWFAATLAALAAFLQERMARYDTAKPIEACSVCVLEADAE